MLQPLALAGALTSATYAHGPHPRTPGYWDPAACMTIVDRTVDPTLTLRYTIPYEDAKPDPGEVADSRRHQFLALCHDYEPALAYFPAWISDADVAAAIAAQIDLVSDPGPEDILTSSTAWQGCWTRITGDDERRPITWEAAMEPVVWDTTGLPVGPQVVYGYTWEPPFNIWWRRAGVVQVVDDLDPAASPPALAITNTEIIAYVDDPPNIEGCVQAMDGATLTASFIDISLDAPTWKAFAEDVPVTGPDFSIPLVLPPEAIGRTLALRVEVVDPLDRRHTAHLGEAAYVLPAQPPQVPTSGDDGDDNGDSSESETTDDTASAEAPDAGCGCRAPARPPAWGLLLLLLARRRVRRTGRLAP